MKRNLSLLCLTLLCGCTTLHTIQTDESPERTITTDIKATAWFSSAQTISKLKATTTDRTQSIGTDAIGQAGATNTVATLNAIIKILELVKPMP